MDERFIPSAIIDAVCGYYGITSDELIGRSRKPKLVLARQMAMYLMRKEIRAGGEPISFPRIGEETKRHYSTVIHADGRIKERMGSDLGIREAVEEIRRSYTKN